MQSISFLIALSLNDTGKAFFHPSHISQDGGRRHHLGVGRRDQRMLDACALWKQEVTILGRRREARAALRCRIQILFEHVSLMHTFRDFV